MQFDKLSFLSYGFLYLTVVSLWLPRNWKPFISILFFVFALALGLLSSIIKPVALIPIFSLAILLYYSQVTEVNFLRFFAYGLILLLSIGLASHLFPGFYNLKVIDHIYISKNAIPYTLYLNFDTGIVGIFILGITHHLISNQQDWIKLLKKTMFPFLGLIVTIMLLAISLGLVRFDPKLPSTLPLWFITNLLFVSVAEEAIFRGFLQKKISFLLDKKAYGDYLSILIAAVLFGLMHYMGGIKYIFLATITGIGYGWIYNKTQYIESAIASHFGLNLIHFIFFTYPLLASAI